MRSLWLMSVVAAGACGGGDPDAAVQLWSEREAEPGAEVIYDVVVTGESVVVDVVFTAAAGATVTAAGGGAIDGVDVRWTGVEVAGETTLQVSAVLPLAGPAVSRAAIVTPVDDRRDNDEATWRTVLTFPELYTVDGLSQGESFGWEVEPVGDIDGDGAADYAVSAPDNTLGGRIYVYSGAAGERVFTFTGASGSRLGIDMDAADLDGDGIAELIVGAPGFGGGSLLGRVVVYSLTDGAPVLELSGETVGDRFGWNAGDGGDADGDGVGDLVIGAPDHGGRGKVYVYSGADGALIWAVGGPGAGSSFGHAARQTGDVDGDDIADIAVGAPDAGAGARGAVIVLSGADGAPLFTIDAPASGGDLGQFWISSPGDLDGDGVPDIYAADLLDSNSTGRGGVYSGVDGALILDIPGERAGGQMGIGHPAGDVDGDGVGDLVMAAWLSGEGATGGGKSYVISGADGTALRTWTSTTAGENFGFDAVALGDLSGDGVIDFAVSGGISPSTAGLVHIIPGVAP